MRKERISIRVGASYLIDDLTEFQEKSSKQDQDRQAQISMLVNRVMNSSREKELTEESFPEEGKTITRISNRSEQILKEHKATLRRTRLLELSNKGQCEHCHKKDDFRSRPLPLWDVHLSVPIRIPSLRSRYSVT